MINYKSYIIKTLIIIFDSCTLSVSLPNLISLPVHKSLSHFLTFLLHTLADALHPFAVLASLGALDGFVFQEAVQSL